MNNSNSLVVRFCIALAGTGLIVAVAETFQDGRKETINWKAGQVRFNPKETYSQKNTGKTELVLYSVTIK